MSPQGLNMGLVCSALDKAYRRLPNLLHCWDLGNRYILNVEGTSGAFAWAGVFHSTRLLAGIVNPKTIKEFMQWVEQTRILAAE